MRSKYFLPLVTGVSIALLGVGLVANTRVNVAYAVTECVYRFEHPLPKEATDLHKLQECEHDARHSGIGLGYVLAIFALAGATAAVLGYVAGKQEIEKAWQQWPLGSKGSVAGSHSGTHG
jgi:hypothetical protein